MIAKAVGLECHLLVPVLLLFPISGLAQTSSVRYWEPTIFDSSTKLPLEVASISLNRKTDFSLDERGVAKIPSELLKRGDSVFVSCLGYKTEKFVIEQTGSLKISIGLQPAVYALDQVNIIKNKKYRPKELIVGTRSFSISQSQPSIETKYALFINNMDKNKGYIKSVGIRMKNGSGGRKTPFRLRLYARGEGKRFPEKELMEGIIVQNTENREWFEIDLGYLGIKMPDDGFFVCAEILPASYYSHRYKKIHGSYWRELPNLAFTTFPKSINKNNYSMEQYRGDSWKLATVEYQMRARLVLEE